jgi:hypothetical protein
VWFVEKKFFNFVFQFGALIVQIVSPALYQFVCMKFSHFQDPPKQTKNFAQKQQEVSTEQQIVLR